MATTAGATVPVADSGIRARFFDLSPDLLCTITLDGCFELLNPAWEGVLGWPVEELRGSPVLDLVHPDEREALGAQLIRLAGSDVALPDFELRMGARDGAWHSIVWRAHSAGGSILATGRDMTAIREAGRIRSAAFEAMGEGLVVLDRETRILATNPAAERILGFAPDSQGTRSMDARWGTIREDGSPFPGEEHPATEVLRTGRPREGVVMGVHREDGAVAWISINARPLSFGSDGRPDGVVCSFSDITALKRAEERAAHLAMHDPLTGLGNRELLSEQLERELARAVRDGRSVGLLFMDLDEFKLVNDSLGHSAGDRVLQEVSVRLEAVTRHGDLLFRQGGDEFLLVSTDLPGDRAEAAEGIEDLAGRIEEALGASFEVGGRGVRIHASIGYALFPHDASDRGNLVRRADIAMYRAKREIGTGLHGFRSEDDRPDDLSLVSRLGEAIEHGELELHYQPIVDLREGRTVAVEALLRWRDPQVGLLGPDAFVGLAELTGLIVPIGRWVLTEALEARARTAQPGIGVNVNVSAVELRHPEFADHLAGLVAEHDLAPGLLTLEVTESTAMREPEAAAEVFARISDLGVRLSIDDFGIGYSSLGRLRDFGVAELKIDRSFVRSIPSHRDSATITAAACALAGSLGVRIVAEGVETDEQVAFLQEAGADLAQGFRFGAPVPEAEIDELLAREPIAGPSPAAVATNGHNSLLPSATLARSRGAAR